MELTKEQITEVAQWVAEGETISNVQKRIQSDFGILMTFMDTRFLLDDLDLTLRDLRKEAEDAKKAKEAEEAMETPEAIEEPPQMSGVSVEVSSIARPGALVSGTVTFSDAEEAEWYVDQMGQLGLKPKQEGYRPNDEDIKEFQMQLQEAMQKKGF